jgi:hypothetical protein
MLSFVPALLAGGISLGCGGDDGSGVDGAREALEDGADDGESCTRTGPCNPPGATCSPGGSCWACSSWCYTTTVPVCTCSAAGTWQCSYWDCGGAPGACGGNFCDSSCTTRCYGDGGTEGAGAEDGETYDDGLD